MNFHYKKPASHMLRSAVAAAIIGLAGCAAPFTHLSSGGAAAFPDIDQSWTKDGRGVSADAMRLAALRVGINANEAFDALGAPHFSEGLGRAEFWDYIVRFDGNTQPCRLKLQWDMGSDAKQNQSPYLVKNIYWSSGCPVK